MTVQSTLWIPADRFLAVVDRQGRPHVGKQSTMGRTLCRLRTGEQAYISLHSADRILTRLHLHYWFHVPAEQGGLADIYVGEVQYGSPNRLARGLKYTTEEARVEARRRSWRESKARRLEEAAA